jgi:hypothetical protein
MMPMIRNSTPSRCRDDLLDHAAYDAAGIHGGAAVKAQMVPKNTPPVFSNPLQSDSPAPVDDDDDREHGQSAMIPH